MQAGGPAAAAKQRIKQRIKVDDKTAQFYSRFLFADVWCAAGFAAEARRCTGLRLSDFFNGCPPGGLSVLGVAHALYL